MAYTKYSLTPADNNSAPPNGAPEGMLPSAVNDTMRDMMAQIRDVGDGIRGGTYTMTAPVITGGSINGTTVGATTASTGAFTTLAASGTTTLSANQIISVTDNSNAALRITQLGTGNALLVEDSANPDATPFVIDASGKVLLGGVAVTGGGNTFPQFQISGNGNSSIGQNLCSLSVNQFIDSGSGSGGLSFNRSNSATVGTNSIVSNNDQLGYLRWSGADGTNFIRAAQIVAEVDGTPDTNDMPGRLVFLTTADGASNVTERMRINNAGSVGIGGTSLTGVSLAINKALTGAVGSNQVNATYQINSDVTTSANTYASAPSTQAASFTLGNLRHFFAGQGSLGADSAITNQVGYLAQTTLTGATNNYGFQGAVAAGTNRWNLYMNGTANNYMAGGLGIGTTSVSADVPLTVNLVGTGINTNGIRASQTIPATSTSTHKLFQSIASTAASAFTLGTLTHYEAFQSTIGAGSAVTTQNGFIVQQNLTGATNNYGFFGNIAAGSGRFNLYMQGTADNYMAGSLGIGSLPAGFTLTHLGGNSRTASFGISTTQYFNPTAQSDVTDFRLSEYNPATAAASFTVGNVQSIVINDATKGAGSTITSQTGIRINNLTSGANNYGILSDVSSGANKYNIYVNGSADNYLAGRLTVSGGTAIPAGGTAGVGVNLSSTSNFGVFFGSGAPTLSAAKGSLYLRSDGSGINDRMYVNTNGTTTWTAVVTAA